MQDAFEESEQYLDLLPLLSRDDVGLCFGDRVGQIAAVFRDAARHLAGGSVGTAAKLEHTAIAITFACADKILALLSGYDAMLSGFDFENWYFFAKRTLRGPNLKAAYDGYLNFYHLPVLHRNTFCEDMSNQAIYTAWGPHQRV